MKHEHVGPLNTEYSYEEFGEVLDFFKKVLKDCKIRNFNAFAITHALCFIVEINKKQGSEAIGSQAFEGFWDMALEQYRRSGL